MLEIYLSYEDFLRLAEKSKNIIKEIIFKKPNYYKGILCPLRGGFYLSDYVSRSLSLPVQYIYISSYDNGKIQKDFKIHFLPQLEKNQKYLICDDILATGKTVNKILELYPNTNFEILTLYKHKNRHYPFKHYWLREIDSSIWVNFFWEISENF